MAKQGRGLLSKHVIGHLDLMHKSRVAQQVVTRTNCPRLFIHGTNYDVTNSRAQKSSGTHDARLQGDVHRCFIESPSTERKSGTSQRDNFGVCGRVVINLSSIFSERDDGTVDDYDTSNRNVIVVRGELRLFECATHEGQMLGTHGDIVGLSETRMM